MPILKDTSGALKKLSTLPRDKEKEAAEAGRGQPDGGAGTALSGD